MGSGDPNRCDFDAEYKHAISVVDEEIVLGGLAGNKENLTVNRYGDGFEDRAKERHAFFSLDGSKIVFWANEGPGCPQVYNDGYWFSMNPDGSDQKLILRGSGSWRDLPLYVSPDGSKLLLEIAEGEKQAFSPTTYDGSLGISRDGKFFALRGGSVAIYSSAGKMLSFANASFHRVSWAPDNSAIVGVVRGNIYYMPVKDGALGNAIQLTATGDRKNSSPIFSPDSSKIAFISEKDNLVLWVMNSDGSEKRKVTDLYMSRPQIIEWTAE